MARKVKRNDGGERATKVVTVRLTEREFRILREQAADHVTLSDLVRSRVLGGGPREPVLLKQVAALSALGRRLTVLADKPGMSRVSILATLDQIGEAIDAIAPKCGR